MAITCACTIAVFLIKFLIQVNAYDDCEEIGICDSVEDYPTKIAHYLIEELKAKNTLFNIDKLNDNFGFRIGDHKNEVYKYKNVNELGEDYGHQVNHDSESEKKSFFYKFGGGYEPRTRHYHINPNTGFRISGDEHRHRFRHYHSRFSGNEAKQELCEFTTKQMIPKKAKDVNGVMRYIVNDDNNPVQTFNIAICNTKEANCNFKLKFIPTYRGVCIQKKALRQMIYINDRNQSAVEYFQVPICCSCMLVRVN